MKKKMKKNLKMVVTCGVLFAALRVSSVVAADIPNLTATANGHTWNVTLLDGLTAVITSCSPEPNGKLSIPGSVTFNEEVWIDGARVVSVPVSSVAEWSFANCLNMTEVEFPNSSSFYHIRANAFNGCSNITSAVMYNGLSSIGEKAFAGCRSLTSVSVPKSVDVIGEGAFAGCASLREVVIPDSVEYVGECAFENCLSLERVVVGSGVENFDSPLFSWWDEDAQTRRNGSLSLKELVVASPTFYNAMFRDGYNNWLDAAYPAVTNVVFAGDAFETVGEMGRFPALAAVTIPDGVLQIEPGAFAGCAALGEVVIPDSVEYVGECAFENCLSLERVVVGSGVECFDSPLFSWWDEDAQTRRNGSPSLKELLVASPTFYNAMFRDGYNNWLDAAYPAVTNVVFAGDAFETVGEMGRFPALAAVTIPDGVLQIEPGAFAGCAALGEVVIPDSVEYVGECAFENCLSLERVVVGSGVECFDSPLFSWWDEDAQTRRNGSPSLKELLVASPAFYRAMFWDGNGYSLNAAYPAVTNVVFGWRFGDVPENCAYAFPALVSANVAEAFPQANSEAELALILKDSCDGGLTNITNVAAYNSFVTWAESVGAYGQSRNQTMMMVKSSPNAWLSYALGAPALIENELKSEDVTISSFEPVGENGAFSFEVTIDGVNIGGGVVDETTLKTNLKKVLGIEGSATLTPNAFSPDNIEITFDAPVDGKARFTVTPPVDAGNSFFMRVKVK